MVENSFRYRCHDGWFAYRMNDASPVQPVLEVQRRFLKPSSERRRHIATLNLRRRGLKLQRDPATFLSFSLLPVENVKVEDQGTARATKEVNYRAHEFFMDPRDARHHRRQILRGAFRAPT